MATPTMPPSRRCAGLRSAATNWTFAGSDEGARRTAAGYTLIADHFNEGDPRLTSFIIVVCRNAE
jgi:hypothetical protein